MLVESYQQVSAATGLYQACYVEKRGVRGRLGDLSWGIVSKPGTANIKYVCFFDIKLFSESSYLTRPLKLHLTVLLFSMSNQNKQCCLILKSLKFRKARRNRPL